jgi:O-antigen/teichoic acid export membrane protein
VGINDLNQQRLITKVLSNQMLKTLFWQFIAAVTTFCAYIQWNRLFGSDDVAKLFILLAAFGLINDFLDFGGCSWSIRSLLYEEISKIEFARFFMGRVIRIITIYSFMAILALFLGLDIDLIIVLVIVPIGQLVGTYLQQYCIATEKYALSGCGTLFERLAWNFPSLAIVIWFPSEHVLYYSICAGSVIQIIFVLSVSRKFQLPFFRCRPNLNDFVMSMKFEKASRKIGISSVITDFYGQDTFLVSQFSSLDVAGEYSLIQKNRNIAILGFSIFASRFRFMGNLSNTDYRKFVWQSAWILLCNVTVLSIVFFVPLPLVNLIFGYSSEILVESFRWSILSFAFFGFISIIQGYLFAMKQDMFLQKFSIIMVPLTLIFTTVGAKIDGTYGASISIAIMSAIQLFWLFLYTFSKTRKY